jgi:HD-GYP domain-containing protein (c-di-GMP phosphodiesterase class II)
MLKRIAVEDLRPGMFVSELCGSWVDHSLWRSRFACRTSVDVDKVIKSGVRQLWIDTERGSDVVDPRFAAASLEQAQAKIDATLAQADEAAREDDRTLKRVPFADEARQAQKLLSRTRPALLELFSSARTGEHLDIGHAGEVVAQVQASVARNPAALISLARLRGADDYTYLHALACCAMMTGLARQLGMDDRTMQDAGLAGLLLDIGKARVPAAILRKPGELTDEETGVMRSHAEKGHELLCEMGITVPAVLDVCLHHHEKIDGSGYPHGLKGEAIGEMARMGAICDVYDAITTARPYRRGGVLSPSEAIRKMAEWAPDQYDPKIFQAFVKTVGVYPIGSPVLLACGRLGIVVENHEHNLLRPRVKVFFSTQSKVRIAPEVVDLAQAGSQNRIVARVDPATFGLTRIDEVWAAEALAALRPRAAAAVQ